MSLETDISTTPQDRYARLAALRPARRSAASATRGRRTRGHAPDIPEGCGAPCAISRRRTAAKSLWRAPRAAPVVFRAGRTRGARRTASGGAASARARRAGFVADPQQWLFLDTETTGLAGGTGTYPFLVGIAWWDAGGLEVEQFFMREHSEEHSLLVALAERLAERRVLVTFNGKSFDWPLLETRYRMTRTIQRARAARASRFSASGAESVAAAAGFGAAGGAGTTCARLESRRGHDVGADSADLFRLFARRARPSRSSPSSTTTKWTCAGWRGWRAAYSRVLANPETHGRDALELFGVSRICERRGERSARESSTQRSIAPELPPETDRAARRSLARLAKREGDFGSRASCGKACSEIRARALKPTSNWRFITSAAPASRIAPRTLARKALAELRNANRLGHDSLRQSIASAGRNSKSASRALSAGPGGAC